MTHGGQSGPDRDIVVTMAGFVRTLRAAGMVADTGRFEAMLRALHALDIRRGADAYWAGRLTLCTGPDDIARYDAAFAAYFGGEIPRNAAIGLQKAPSRVVGITALDGLDGETDAPTETQELATQASEVELLRQADFATLSDEQREEVRRMLAQLHTVGPTRRSLRTEAAARGDVDPRRVIRAMLRRGGETVELPRRNRRDRPRRIVLLLDVSGSMEPYAEAYLRFAHTLSRRRPQVEVFTIGTRLTRITRAMSARDPDAALKAVAAAVPDWSGGTRLGELLQAFLDRWGQRGMARGAVVVVASDGWERGEVDLLADQMARLRRLARAVVWVNPHVGKDGFAPTAAGMSAALPHIDRLVSGHSVEAFAELAKLLSEDFLRAARLWPVPRSAA
ncbi:vWA domain-containing protein [Sporichthya polymorpha]|uniref:vWA domain-containing protein n=1 Tax=Sporichthya polymorpha TaxID=35751 RepID=UPI0003643143|nr:VWA domain-containing protein [Sporichthya polymorpha]